MDSALHQGVQACVAHILRLTTTCYSIYGLVTLELSIVLNRSTARQRHGHGDCQSTTARLRDSGYAWTSRQQLLHYGRSSLQLHAMQTGK